MKENGHPNVYPYMGGLQLVLEKLCRTPSCILIGVDQADAEVLGYYLSMTPSAHVS